MQITYFINQYPKVSHTFIRREIMALERQGFDVQRISLRGWGETPVDPDDIQEQKKTQYVLKQGMLKLILISMTVLLKHPLRFLKTLKLALSMGQQADRPVFYHLIYFLEACQVFQWVKERESQHMHAHFGTNPSEIVMLVNALSYVPYSFTVHGPEEFDRPKFLKLKEKIEQSKFVVAISSFGRSQLQRWVDFSEWHKIKEVHCGLESDFYRESKPLPSSQVTKFVCVGRICEQKGQMLLIEAAKRLRDEGLEFELTLAGDGDMRAEVERLVKSYNLSSVVDITGWISSDAVRNYLLDSHALVLPSFAEGLPVVIMEAMSLKRPVISTYIAGIPELLNDDNGWLIPAGSVDALVDAMRELAKATLDELIRMGQAGHQRVTERHHVDTEAEKLAKYFKENI